MFEGDPLLFAEGLRAEFTMNLEELSSVERRRIAFLFLLYPALERHATEEDEIDFVGSLKTYMRNNSLKQIDADAIENYAAFTKDLLVKFGDAIAFGYIEFFLKENVKLIGYYQAVFVDKPEDKKRLDLHRFQLRMNRETSLIGKCPPYNQCLAYLRAHGIAEDDPLYVDLIASMRRAIEEKYEGIARDLEAYPSIDMLMEWMNVRDGTIHWELRQQIRFLTTLFPALDYAIEDYGSIEAKTRGRQFEGVDIEIEVDGRKYPCIDVSDSEYQLIVHAAYLNQAKGTMQIFASQNLRPSLCSSLVTPDTSFFEADRTAALVLAVDPERIVHVSRK